MAFYSDDSNFAWDIQDDDLHGLLSDSEDTEEELDTGTDDVPLQTNANFTARAYQNELFKCAKDKNSILVLGTGSGKTYIATLLIKEFADQIRGSMSKGSKRTVFIVNTVPLVYQQAAAIETHTALKVGKYEGSMGVDFWEDSKWAAELEENEVLVVTAQIFLELVLHARLPLRRVNLLIMDECHHAVGNHPMREIMREYNTLKRAQVEECPRVMGLTASVINKKCNKTDVSKNMEELEKTMDCALVTSVYRTEVLKYTTRPSESIIIYRKSVLSNYQEHIKAQLDGIQNEIEEIDLDKKQKKFVSKRINNVKYIMAELGDWCVARAVYYEKESLEENAKAEDIPIIRDLFQRLLERFNQIYDMCVDTESRMGNPRDHVSHKVLRLLDSLLAIKEDDVAGLIFVERRNTAKILYDFFLKLAEQNPDLNFIKPLYIVGANTRPALDLKLAELELRKQKETLKKFKRGEANFIISTSVLEEGVDIRKCNAVIRFDRPVNYRAYVQSRGRARAVPSKYLLMIDEGNLRLFINDLDVYREIEKTLVTLCHNRDLPDRQDVQEHFDSDQLFRPYAPFGSQGPKVTANSAISLINHYCGKLPQDKFTVLAPEVFIKRNEDQTKVGILMPTCAKIKTCVYGDYCDNIDQAKKSAALQLCKDLHKMGELNSYLRPTVQNEESLSSGLLDINLEKKQDGQPEPGTKKRRQIYRREICKSLKYETGGFYNLYGVKIQPVGTNTREVLIDSTTCDLTVGLICKGEIIHCPFNLYGGKIGEVSVTLRHLKVLNDLTSKEFEDIKHFHKLTMENLLHVNMCLMEFKPEKTHHGTFVVPLDGHQISHDLLHKIASLPTLSSEVPSKTPKYFNMDYEKYEDAIIYPLYREERQEFYYVTGILTHLNPLSEFPENKKQFANYEGYFMSRYDARITNRNQPLIGAKHLPKELNYLKAGVARKKSTRDPPNFIPELCGVFPFKMSLWWQISCIPSILYRLNSFGVAHRLSTMIAASPVPNAGSVRNMPFDFKWAERTATSKDSNRNLAVELTFKKNEFIYPFMLSHALTLLGTNDVYNMERLELLGDAFLKYITGEFVFLKFPEDHEGKLSPRRTILTCNKTLYHLAKERLIPKKIQAVYLQPRVNGIIHGFRVKKEVENKLLDLDYPHDKWQKLPVPQDLDGIEEVIDRLEKVEKEKSESTNKQNNGSAPPPSPKASCYNAWKEQEVSDKSIADCVEAIIGAYLLQCGTDAAKNFLHWMGIGVEKGIGVLSNTQCIPPPILKKESWSRKELNALYKKACLDRLEETIQYRFSEKAFIVQAVTHPSYIQNRITDTYQRLEFLGDAVLDYLITGFIYASHISYSPGQMTELRSYYVNNETLARVAARFGLQKHLLHMTPKLQATIDKFLTLYNEEEDGEREFVTEEEEEDLEEIELPKSLGDLIEAIIGAVYLDCNRDLEVTWNVITTLMVDVFQNKQHENIPQNCVKQLYENTQAVEFIKVPHENGNLASCILKINDDLEVRGSGKNYKVAKNNAAKKGLRLLKEKRG